MIDSMFNNIIKIIKAKNSENPHIIIMRGIRGMSPKSSFFDKNINSAIKIIVAIVKYANIRFSFQNRLAKLPQHTGVSC